MKHQMVGNLAGDVIALMRDLLNWQEHIERGLRDTDGMFSFNDVVAMVLRQEVTFYNFDDAIVLCQLETFPGYKAYHCFLACGDFEKIIEMEPQLMAIAKELGCEKFSLAGRKGWERKLKQHGWKPVLTVMHKELN